MSPIICPFCEAPSPPGAKFCSACGGALHLAPCPSCGAVNDVSAVSCYQCRAVLRKRDEDEAGVPAAAALDGGLRSGGAGFARIAAGAAALVVIGGLGFYAYQQRMTAEPMSPPAAGAEVAGKVVPAAAGLIRPQADSAPSREDEDKGADVAVASEPAPARASPARVAASPARADRQIVESPKSKPAAVRQNAVPRECTYAVAALGLCQLSPGQTEAEKTAVAGKVAEDAQASTAAKAPAVAPAPVRQAEPCTEAVAALGLCAPASKDKGKGE